MSATTAPEHVTLQLFHSFDVIDRQSKMPADSAFLRVSNIDAGSIDRWHLPLPFPAKLSFMSPKQPVLHVYRNSLVLETNTYR